MSAEGVNESGSRWHAFWHSNGQIEHYAKSVDQLKLNEAAMRKMEA